MKMFTVLVVVLTTLTGVAVAQEVTPTPVPVCSEADRAVLDACVATCEAAAPQCQKSIVDLEALRAKISEKCRCDKARNYGQYRSCVNTVVNPMRSFSLLNAEVKAAIAADNAACKATIVARKSKGKGKNNK